MGLNLHCEDPSLHVSRENNKELKNMFFFHGKKILACREKTKSQFFLAQIKCQLGVLSRQKRIGEKVRTAKDLERRRRRIFSKYCDSKELVSVSKGFELESITICEKGPQKLRFSRYLDHFVNNIRERYLSRGLKEGKKIFTLAKK